MPLVFVGALAFYHSGSFLSMERNGYVVYIAWRDMRGCWQGNMEGCEGMLAWQDGGRGGVVSGATRRDVRGW